MNRLSPLIARRPRAAAIALSAPRAHFAPSAEAPALSPDLKLFATSFLAGLVFFGTYLA